MINHFKYLLLILFSSFSFATTIHVATTGSDDAGDGTESNPYATIQKGVDISVEGDTVFINNGEYFENISIEAKNINVIGEDRNETIINGNGSNRCIFVESNDSLHVESISLTNGNSSSGSGIHSLGKLILYNVNVYNNLCPVFNNSSIPEEGSGAVFSNNDISIESSFIFDNIGQVSAVCSFSDVYFNHTVIHNNGFVNTGPSAPYTIVGANVDLDYSTFYKNKISNWYHINGTSGVVISSSIIQNNYADFGDVFYINNPDSIIFSNVQTVDCCGTGVEIGNINSDPLFCSFQDNNFYLAENSPCIGSGADGLDMGALGVGCDELLPSLIINEIMNNPSAVSDSDGEWFEIVNNGEISHDLNGWTIKDDGSDSHVISSSLVINPGEYLVLGNNEWIPNGGTPVNYQYDNITLSNSGDEIILIDQNGIVIDSVSYDGGPTFPDPNGASMALVHPDSNNTVGTNWQESTTAYGDGDLGTPGLPNFSSDIDVELTTIDFDTVLVGESSDKVLTISNSGNTPLVIDSVYTSSGAFTLPFTETSVETSLELTITFTPSVYGIVEDTLVLKTNDPDEGHVEIPLIGLGYVPSPNIVLETTSVDFGTIMDGLTETIELQIANDGDATLSISSVYNEGSTNFTILNFSASIAETDTGSIDIQFSPDDETSFSGTLYIVSNDPDTDTLMVALSGIGGEQAPIMTLSDNELYFGTVETGTTVEREVIIYNEGMLDLEIEEITITGSDYYTTTFSDGSVEPGDSVIVPFSFAPTEQVIEVMATATVASNIGTQIIELKAGHFGPVWHVATTGSNENGNGSIQNPYSSISFAYSNAKNGDTVFVNDGEYYDQLFLGTQWLNIGSLGEKNIYLIGQSRLNTIISYNPTFPTIVYDNSNNPPSPTLESTFIHIENFSIYGVMDVRRVKNIELKNVMIRSNLSDFGSTNPVINFSSNSSLESSFLVSNSIIADEFSMIGLSFGTDENDIFQLTNSTVFVNNLNFGCSPGIIENSILWTPREDQFDLSNLNCQNFSIENSIVFGGFEGTGNINIDPLFCDPENGDYSLASNSPAIGAGENGTDIGALGIGCNVAFGGSVWYVSTTGSDDQGNGTLENPYQTIQKGLDMSAMSGDTILLSNGEYNQSVLLYENKSVTISSNYIFENDTNYINNTKIKINLNSGWSTRADSVYVIGLSFMDHDDHGTSFFDRSNYLRISHCKFKNNSGTLRLEDGEKIIKNSTFENNGDSLSITGAIFFNSGGKLLVENSIFKNNYGQYGGGIYFKGDSGFVENCHFYNNIANHPSEDYGNTGDGGAIANYPELDEDEINYLEINNSIFVGNYAGDDGGAVATAENMAAGLAQTNIKNCTFIDNNSGDKGNTFYLSYGSEVRILNTIARGDSLAEFLNTGENIRQTLYVNYSNFEGGQEDIIGFQSNLMDIYYHDNFSSDPLFCDSENMNFSLAENSPCVGSGEGGENIGALDIGCEAIELSIDKTLVPNLYALHQNYPNPFNPTTTISYDLPEASVVSLSIYDLMGREIRTMINSEQTAGFKNIQWNATDNLGKSVPAGMYIYTIQAGEFRQTKKMVLLK